MYHIETFCSFQNSEFFVMMDSKGFYYRFYVESDGPY